MLGKSSFASYSTAVWSPNTLQPLYSHFRKSRLTTLFAISTSQTWHLSYTHSNLLCLSFISLHLSLHLGFHFALHHARLQFQANLLQRKYRVPCFEYLSFKMPYFLTWCLKIGGGVKLLSTSCKSLCCLLILSEALAAPLKQGQDKHAIKGQASCSNDPFTVTDMLRQSKLPHRILSLPHYFFPSEPLSHFPKQW